MACGPGYRACVRGPPRIVTSVIEARFDDLTGHDPSFRLVGPAGVLEARRPDEVTGVLAAAEQAAARGLWVAGYVAYEAAPGLDPALRVRSPGPDDAFAAAPSPGSRCSRDAKRPSCRTRRPTTPVPAATWAAVDDALRLRRGDRPRSIEHIAAGETYQVNFTLRLRARVDGDPRGLYRDLCFAQRGAYAGYLDTGRFRVLSASPELFFRIDGRPHRHQTDEGDRAAGAMARRGRGDQARLEGSVKDRAENAMIVDLLAQRSRAGRAGGNGHLERHLCARALRDGLAADLRRGRRPPRPGGSLVDVFRRCSRAAR